MHAKTENKEGRSRGRRLKRFGRPSKSGRRWNKTAASFAGSTANARKPKPTASPSEKTCGWPSTAFWSQCRAGRSRVVSQKHIVDASPNVERNLDRATERLASGGSIWKSRIHLRRAHGLPEALILENLAEDEMKNIQRGNNWPAGSADKSRWVRARQTAPDGADRPAAAAAAAADRSDRIRLAAADQVTAR